MARPPLRPLSRLLSQLLIIILASFWPVVASHAAEEDVIIVLDASGSMWGQIDGKPKIEIARNVMSRVLTDLDGKANIGVVTYGHRRKGACNDIETIIPVGKVDQKAYMATINKLSPKGKTPIADAVRKSAQELRFTENKATVVLVSDGLETCEADPCALAKDLEAQGIDFTVHVIGFGLKGRDTTSLQCLATETGGQYLAADNVDELGDAFETVVVETPKPEPVVVAEKPKPEPKPAALPTSLKVDVVLAEGSEPLERAYVYIIPEAENKNRSKAVGSGSSRRIHKVPAGKYHVEAKLGKIVRAAEVEVINNQENRVQIVLNAGLLSVDAIAEEGGEPLKKAYITISEPSANVAGKRKYITGGNERTLFTLPVGKYYASAKLGKAVAGQEVEVLAGKRTDTVILLASGLLKVSVFEEAGGKAQTRGAYVYVYESEKQIDGKRKRVTGANPRQIFSLPAGKYYVEATIGKAKVGKEVAVIAGQRADVDIVAEVGAIKAMVVPVAGAKPLKKANVYIYERDKGLDGSRKGITSARQGRIIKLPAGQYHLIAKIDKVSVAQDFEIKAGKLAEPEIVLNAGALSVAGSRKARITVYAADKNLDGTRDAIANIGAGKPTLFPQGKYFVIGKDGDITTEAEIEIKPGKLTEMALKP